MLALKMISSVLVIASSAGIGMYFSSTLKERLETIRELKKVMLLLRGNITYSNATLPEALNSIANRQKGELKDFLSYVSSELYQMNGKTAAEIWKNGVELMLKESALSKKDKESLIQFGNGLGYLDREMQLGTIDFYIASLETDMDEIQRTKREKTYLYNSLGVMGGIFLTIIFI